MTLKDWFAGQIIAAMLSSDASSAIQRDQNGQLCEFDTARLANLAKNAYQVADALMKARATAQRREIRLCTSHSGNAACDHARAHSQQLTAGSCTNRAMILKSVIESDRRTC